MAGAARRGPAPIASFDHDASDEPPAPGAEPVSPDTHALAPPAPRARSRSAGGVPAPRIDISRASSSSHHDSRDSSPEMLLFAGGADDARAQLTLAFREEGALELRSSTEELAFLEGAPGPPPAPAPTARRASRKDSQGSETALLGVSGRTSRLSSVGSQCSAHSALSAISHVSRLSAVSGASRSPSPHKMLLETSFCGPKPIDTDPELCTAAVEERLLELAAAPAVVPVATPVVVARSSGGSVVAVQAVVEALPSGVRPPAPAPAASAEPRAASRPRVRRSAPSDRPEVYRACNRSKDVIRIKLKPDDEYDDDDDPEEEELATPATRPAVLRHPSPPRSPRRSPSPAGAPVSRKSSFCSLFKSRETIASPDSPGDALRRKKSLTEGRSRSKSRERESSRARGSVLSLFRTPRRSAAPSPAASPPAPHPPPAATTSAEKLKYYEESMVIHIPLHTPPDEPVGQMRPESVRPASAPQPLRRAELPDGSIIIPLHSPTEVPSSATELPEPVTRQPQTPPASALVTARSPSPQPVVCPTTTFGSSPSFVPEVTPDCPPTTSSVSFSPAPSTSLAYQTSPLSGTATPTAAPLPAADAASPAGVSSGEMSEPVVEERSHRRRKERLIFTTHVGSTEQVFSTQFSITKTPSVTSEISEIVLPEVGSDSERGGARSSGSSGSPGAPGGVPSAPRDEVDTERRGLVVQESFEEELPYVPTTLPLERSLALPMVPVRERDARRQQLARVERPRGAPSRPGPPPPPPAAPPPAPSAPRLRIHLPRRAGVGGFGPGPAALPTATPAAPPPPMPRAPTEWVDFEEVPEKRKVPKRIETLPAEGAGGGGVVFSYVEPEECRCECHGHAHAPRDDDELPLLRAPHGSSPEDGVS